MNRTLTTLTTLAAAAIAFASVPGVAAQTTPGSEPNYEFILDEAQARSLPPAVTEAVYEFQLGDGRSMTAAARDPVVSYEFILERPAPAPARVSTTTNYEFQLHRDGGSASSATRSAYASAAAWSARAD